MYMKRQGFHTTVKVLPFQFLVFIYANSEPQPNAKYSCAASVAIAR